MPRGVRLLLHANWVLLLALVLWMTVSYSLAPPAVERIEVPARFEPVAEPKGVRSEEASEGRTLEESPHEASASEFGHPVQRRAQQAFEAGRVGRAIDLLAEAARTFSGDAGIRNQRGVYLSHAGRTREAIAEFQAALARAPDAERYHFNLGTALLKVGRTEDAIAELERALALNPHYVDARYNLALALAQTGDTDGAIEAYRLAIASDRGRTAASARNNLGVLLLRSHRIREALAEFQAAIRAFPGFTKARFNKAMALSQLGRSDDAATEYRKLLDVEPDHGRALVNLAVLAMRRNAWEEAAALLRRVIGLEPRNARARYNLGLCYVGMGDDARAIREFEAAFELDGTYAAAAYNLALALKREGRTEEAQRRFSEAVRLRPDRSEYHYNLALSLAESGDLDAAIREYRAALALRRDYYKARYNLALAHYRKGDFEQARHVFERARSDRPDSYEAAYNLGLTWLKLKKPELAEPVIRDAVKLDDSVEAHYNLGLALGRQGRYREALAEYRAALSIEPKHVRSIERAAEAYAEIGEHDRAVQRLVLLQKLDPEDPTSYNLGLRAYRSSAFERSLRYLSVSAQGVPELRRRSLSMMGLAQAKLGRLDTAIEVLRAARDEFPESARIRGNLAQFLEESGAHEQAQGELRAALAIDPQNPGLNYALAQMLEAGGDARAAREALGAAIAAPGAEDAAWFGEAVAELAATEDQGTAPAPSGSESQR